SRNYARSYENAFILHNGASEMELIDVGAYPVESRAFSINNKSQVVGDYADDFSGGYPKRAFFWDSGVSVVLENLPWQTSSTARAINEHGQIVGWSGTFEADAYTAVRWDGVIPTDLGHLAGDTKSQAYDINDAGQTVGWSGNDFRSRA